MKLFVTVLYSYSNENAITSQLLEFDTHDRREAAIKKLQEAYSYNNVGSGYQVTCVKL